MKRKTSLAAILLMIVAIAVAGCTAASESNGVLSYDQSNGYPAPTATSSMSAGSSGRGSSPAVPTPITPPMLKALPPSDAQFSSYSPDASSPAIDDRMIVRAGNMSLVVEDIAATLGKISGLADSFKGYVVSSRSWQEGERRFGAISIRVPSDRFSDAVGSIRTMAVDVTSETSSSRDVTEEYTDLSSQLRNLQATEQQLLRLMEKATKVDEILSVQKELTNTRGEIERTKGRMQYLEKTSTTSIIDVQLEQSKLNVKFSVDSRFVRTGQQVRFVAQVVGGFAPYSYEWDFGDGETSNTAMPVHAYKSAGEFNVSLKVMDDRGNSDTETLKSYVTVTVPSSWNPGDVVSNAWNGFASFGRALLTVLIWVGVFSPLWLVVGGILIWRVRAGKKKS